MAVVSKLEARQNRRAAAARIATNLGNHSFMPPRARRNSTVAGARNSASTRWRGSGFEPDDHNRAPSLQPPDMIKPGSKDEKVSLLIAGEELTELKRITWLMSESFGLDTRIENYQGKRPIGFYSWDLECLLAVIDRSCLKRW